MPTILLRQKRCFLSCKKDVSFPHYGKKADRFLAILIPENGQSNRSVGRSRAERAARKDSISLLLLRPGPAAGGVLMSVRIWPGALFALVLSFAALGPASAPTQAASSSTVVTS